MRRWMVTIGMTLSLLAPPVHAGDDPGEAALRRCLDDPARASTAGQVRCTLDATRGYDARMNRAYAALMRALGPVERDRLRAAQRAWLAFRDADAQARGALYATRRGTMYAPMAAAAGLRVVRDRALGLEAALRMLRIDG